MPLYNPPASSSGIAATIVDAKGDLIAATAADTVARKAAGTDDYALVADSSQTDGLAWKPPQGIPPFAAEQYGLKGWSWEPGMGHTNVQVASGQAIYVRIPVPRQFTIANVHTQIHTLASGLTYAAIGVYNSAGTLIGRTGDQITAFGSTGYKTAAVTAESGQSLTVGGTPTSFVHVAPLTVGSVPPKYFILSSVDTNMLALGLASGAFRVIGPETSLSTLPSSRGVSTKDGSVRILWMGLS